MNYNISCPQKILLDALNLVIKATSTKSTLPVLSNVLLEAKENKLYLTTTNLEIGIEHWVDVEYNTAGKITVPVKLLSQYVSLINSAEIIEMTFLEDNTLHLNTTESSTDIKGISADEFPLIPKVEKEAEFPIASNLLLKAINQTVFASALDETRPVLAGVYFNINNLEAKIVATDSYRLAEKRIKLKQPVSEIKVIVPSRTIFELGRIIEHFDEEMNIIVAKNQISFELSNLRLISRLIDGKYPPYEQIIPETLETKAKVNVTDFMRVIKRVSLFAQENASNIKVTLEKSGKLIITAKTDQVGNEQAEIQAETTGETKEIAFNANYLIDALNNVEDSDIFLEVNNESSPGLIKETTKDDYLYVIMPIKL